MKKRLEAELISIAHRILKLKNKSEVDQLYKETQKLYETLTVLKFYQENYEWVKEEVEAQDLEAKLTTSIESEPEPAVESVVPAPEATVEETEAEEEPVVTAETETEEEIIETLDRPENPTEEARIEIKNDPEEIAEQPVITPIFELTPEEEDETIAEIEPAEVASEVKPETKQVALDELLGADYVDPVFVKPNEVSSFTTETKEESKPATALHTGFTKTLEIGLNDRIAFVNNLFGESNEDFNRVISQLNTFNTLEEAKTFLNEMVIPDYDYWVGKEDYIERFMAILEKKFA
ncbi:hypothetical protein [Flavobacterium sedimenticola]|uniref:Uncharacterized protein n=1 Tax=Flavobacterium sedimenticola TaxID=3043286 RepID=A0ABT6XLF0_9FLAO|nr:hypothetical protein [Flavobacterium sedimenticola]MDI9255912.1 hypothetical protein [Flavobacterium sedimenticola]